jgi:ribosomal protein S18 acetylase RimI-like enzyme
MLEFAIGSKAAHLWVFENNPRAQAFYEKHGFLGRRRAPDRSRDGRVGDPDGPALTPVA